MLMESAVEKLFQLDHFQKKIVVKIFLKDKRKKNDIEISMMKTIECPKAFKALFFSCCSSHQTKEKKNGNRPFWNFESKPEQQQQQKSFIDTFNLLKRRVTTTTKKEEKHQYVSNRI